MRMRPLLWFALCFLCVVGCGQSGSQGPPDASETGKQEQITQEPPTAEVRSEQPASEANRPDETVTPQPDAGEPTPDDPPDVSVEPVPEAGSSDEPVTPDTTVGDGEMSEHHNPDQTSQDPCQSPYTQKYGNDVVTVSCQTRTGGYRDYTLSTTHSLRDNDPPGKQIQFAERSGAGELYLRSGNLLFDALFAMAVEETWQNSVKHVKDGSFNNGADVACDCYQTGAKWTWAWTRDTAYAVDLAYALFDPQRSQNTLLFKISDRKASVGGKDTQIVQDTGTGGSWPVSSDRVVWALAAWRLALVLEPTARSSFLQKAYPALVNTLQTDRKVLFDSQDGLYRGEQSFLDWREQTYPSWTQQKLWHIAMSKTLSTNITHLIALEVAAKMAKVLGKSTEQTTYQAWAQDLRKAIQQKFTLASTSLYSTMLTTTLDPSATYKYDLLGNALAVLSGVADSQTTKQIVASYPHADKGPPVVWPQQPFTPIYHNRALWPFVTAYWLRAAKQAENAKVVSHNIHSMVRGAALNLSNMENFEFLSGANYVQDGAYSGPVVNSRRQLWSVAGYLSMVQDILFGLQLSEQGIRFLPYFPREIRHAWFPGSSLTLHGLQYQGKRIDVILQLPPKGTETSGAYRIDKVELNGTTVGDAWLTASQLQATNTLVITLAQPTTIPQDSIKVVQNGPDFRVFWSPREPSITKLALNANALQLTLDNNGEQGVTHNVYRDGVLVASNVPSGIWTDTKATEHATRSYCYAIDSGFTSSGNRSHHSLPQCWLGPNQERETLIDAYRFAAKGGSWGASGSQEAYLKWGQDQDTLEVAALRTDWTGEHLLQLIYRNPHGGFTSGIACATKRVRVFSNDNNQLIAEAILVMPFSDKLPQASSSYLRVNLSANTTYRLVIDNADIVHNMTYLQHFTLFTGGVGGGSQAFNQVEIQGVRMFPVSGKQTSRNTGKLIVFDGNNDLNKFKAAQVVTPGVLLQTWERFALTWDQDWLYIAIVSQGFEDDVKAFNLYLETAGATWPSAKQGTGMTYLNQAPHLPFTPTYMLGVRQKTNNNDGFGPWNGIWRNTAQGWVLQTRLKASRDFHVAADKHTISYRIHRSELGWPQRIRLVGHLVNNTPGNEWKLTLPSQHTPWSQSNKGYYEIELGSQTDTTKWIVK